VVACLGKEMQCVAAGVVACLGKETARRDRQNDTDL